MEIVDIGIAYHIRTGEIETDVARNLLDGSGAVLDDQDRWIVAYSGLPQLERWITSVASSSVVVTFRKALVSGPLNVAPRDSPLIAPQGLSYFPYQEEGIRWMQRTLDQRRAALLGDEMGLGKTIQICGLLNNSPALRRCLIVVPKTARGNWRAELKRWLIPCPGFACALPVYLSDCRSGLDHLSSPEHITIINYSVITKCHPSLGSSYASQITSILWDLIVFDEAQHLKNPRAKRTAAALGPNSQLRARYRVFLSGTFVTARPLDVWPVLRVADAAGLGRSLADFRRSYFWKGQSRNLKDLHLRLSSCTLRRTKAQVGLQLPSKIRKVIQLDSSLEGLKDAIAHEKAIYQRIVHARLRASLKKLAPPASVEEQSLINSARLNTALAKLPYVIATVEDIVAEGRKVVVFAHHHEVLHRLHSSIPGSLLLYGATSDATRADHIRRFQSDPSCQVFIGGLLVAGTAITLTSASDVVFAELSWTPSDISQAEDRCHRIGQTDAVFVQHVLVENSFDHRLLETLLDKQQVASAIIDGHFAEVSVSTLVDAFDAWEAFGSR